MLTAAGGGAILFVRHVGIHHAFEYDPIILPEGCIVSFPITPNGLAAAIASGLNGHEYEGKAKKRKNGCERNSHGSVLV